MFNLMFIQMNNLKTKDALHTKEPLLLSRKPNISIGRLSDYISFTPSYNIISMLLTAHMCSVGEA